MTIVSGGWKSTTETHNTRPHLNTRTVSYPFNLKASYAYNRFCVGHRVSFGF